MITVQVSGAKEVDAMIKSVKNKLINSQRNLNRARAEKFRRKTISYLRNDELDLERLKASTIARRSKNLGGPMFDTGRLARSQEIILRKDNSAEVGYFKSKTTYRRKAKMTDFDLAVIHHTGATFKDGRPPLKARPFMYVSANKYLTIDDDVKLSQKFVRDNVL